MIVEINHQVPHYDSYAAERTRGLYNVDADDGAGFQLQADIPSERDDWQIGAVIGPSGSGKSSILQRLTELAGDPPSRWVEWQGAWPDGIPVIEDLSERRDYAKATAALAAVGLGSVPSWLRPRRVLSMGEGFRADLAQLLLSDHDKVVIDEFTSVLDRQVAQVGAGAFAKAWRRVPGRRVIVFGPHYDVLEWLQPDWWLDTAEGLDEFAADRGVMRPRKGNFQEARHHGGYPGDEIGRVVC